MYFSTDVLVHGSKGDGRGLTQLSLGPPPPRKILLDPACIPEVLTIL